MNESIQRLLDASLLPEPATPPLGSPDAYASPRHRTREARPIRRDVNSGDHGGIQSGLSNDTAAGSGNQVEVSNQAEAKTVEAILVERGKTHGDFSDNARVAQDLKRIVHSQVGWDKLTDVQREALHMILHKIGRIIAGNPNVNDHWDDIAGYAKLVSERIKS